MFGTSYVGFGSDPTYTQKIMKIPDIAWPTFFDSYRESMLKSKGFLASRRSTYDFSTQRKTELIEQPFNREGSLYLACNERRAFYLELNNLNDLSCGHVRKFVTLSIIVWTIYLAQNCIDKL